MFESMPFHPVAGQIEQLLKDRGYWYQRFEHEAVRTSEEAALVRPDYSISQGSKALIVRIKRGADKSFAMLVVPGDRRFDIVKARQVLQSSDIRFANETEVDELTSGVLPGGVPPFGNLFGIPVYADLHVFDSERIIFNAGDRHVSIAMRSNDYKDLVQPQIIALV